MRKICFEFGISYNLDHLQWPVENEFQCIETIGVGVLKVSWRKEKMNKFNMLKVCPAWESKK